MMKEFVLGFVTYSVFDVVVARHSVRGVKINKMFS